MNRYRQPCRGKMRLRERLAAQIAQTGPMTIAQYMTACLHDPKDGYYATRPALGAEGDFITAPLVSQMFGELIGVWMISAWTAMGSPPAFRLVEMGPGDGTLMSDLLRAAKVSQGFRMAADIWLVETSGPLRARQHARLGQSVQWVEAFDEVPGGQPLLLVANELLDCLPARQFERTTVGWAERVVGIDDAGSLRLGLVPADGGLPDARPGAVYERSSAQEALGAALGERLVRDGGAALLIDYGRDKPGFGDTLQAISRHGKQGPLDDPGEADLTVHVDFPSVRAAAGAAGAATALISQATFLARLGVGARSEALIRARPDQAGVLARQLHRLIAADQMGELFKVCCCHAPGWTPPAFGDV